MFFPAENRVSIARCFGFWPVVRTIAISSFMRFTMKPSGTMEDVGMINGGAAESRPAALPSGLPTPGEVDALIAQAMSRLSNEEREKALDDLHGICGMEDEDPSMVSSLLEELDTHLTAIKNETAYALAETKSRKYVSSRGFRMMFLRADRYEPKEAAERMIRFFEVKKHLFGEEKLVKDITLDDLDEGDTEALETGCAQISIGKDKAGRPVVVFLRKLRKYKVTENAARGAYYVLMAAVESPKDQKSGVSLVHYHLDCSNTKALHGKLRNALPVHFASLHLCCDDEEEYKSVCDTIKDLTNKSKVRYRTHLGSHEECQYELSSFGIPRDVLPVTVKGELQTADHTVWIQKRREIEASRAPSSNATALHSDEESTGEVEPDNFTSTPIGAVGGLRPNSGDVLFGRGRAIIDHPGNAQFRQIVDHYMLKYEASGRLQKTCIADIIVRLVKNSCGRFLKKNEDGSWDEVDDSAARKKVAHAFRNRRKIPSLEKSS